MVVADKPKHPLAPTFHAPDVPDGVSSGVRVRSTGLSEPRPIFLVIDDDSNVTSAYRRVLTRYADARVAASAEEGLRLIRGEPFALALIDLWLPERSTPRAAGGLAARAFARLGGDEEPRGFGLAREARVRYPEAAIVLQTGANEQDLPSGAWDIPNVPLVLKPWPLDHVLELAARVVAQREDVRHRTLEAVASIARAAGLSRRETDVLERLALGLPRAALADEFGIAAASVEKVIHRLIRKARAASADELVERVLQRLEVAHDADERARLRASRRR